MSFTKLKGLGLVAMVGLATAATTSESKAQVFTQALMDGYSCSDAVYGTNGTYFDGNAVYTGRSVYTSGCTTGHTSNAAGSVVTATSTLRAAVAQTVGIVSSRIANVKRTASLAPTRGLSVTSFDAAKDGSYGQLGIAGGNTSRGIGVWGQGQFTTMDNSNTSQDSDGDIYTVMVGADKKFSNDNGIVGVSFGYQSGDITTTFNSGDTQSTALIVAPYVSYSLNDTFSLDATAGYADVDYDNTRSDLLTSERFTSKVNAKRLFGSAVLNAQATKGKIILGGKAGASYSRENQSKFTETGATGTTVAVAGNNVKLGQAQLGGSVTYNADKAAPFLNLTGEYDFTKTKLAVATNQVKASDDNFGLRVGAGVNFDLSPNVSALLEGNTVLLRDKYKEHTGTFRIRAEF